MAQLKYLVNINYVPSRLNGQQIIYQNGITQSVPAYADSFYVASMPELGISATGSSYTASLASLLTIVPNTPDNGIGPLSTIKFF
jgi:hypothetical protein